MARNFVRTSSQYLSNATAVVTAAPLSISLRFKTADITNTKVFMGIEDASLAHKFVMYTTSALRINVGTGDAGFSQVVGSTSYSANVWNQAGAVYASSTSRTAYLNGANDGTNTTSRTPASLTQTLIGSEVANYWDGEMAEMGVWNVALTDADMAMLGGGVSPLLVRPEGLVAYWPLIGKTSPEIDLVGGFNMTLNAAPIAADHPRIYMPQGKPYMPGKAAIAAAGTVIPSYMSGGMRELSGGMRG